MFRIPTALAALLLLSSPLLAGAPEAQTLRALWSEADHPSGIYYAKANASLSVLLENLSADPQPLEGSIAFGIAGTTLDDFKALSVTPIAPSTLAPHERAKLPLALTFAAAGPYELRWIHADKTITLIPGPSDIPLQAIFAPRLPANSPQAQTPWLTLLPRPAALVPGYLSDYASQTSVRKFLLDERFAFDPTTNIGLALGASMQLTAPQATGLFADLSKSKSLLILRVTVPVANLPHKKTLTAFREYIADAAQKTNGSLKGIVIVPDPVPAGAQQIATYRDFYLAGYEEAKKHDKSIALLGAGSAQSTRDLLFSPVAAGKHENLEAYVDAIAITDVIAQPALARAQSKLPFFILPPQSGDPWPLVPPAAALAEEAAIVPVPPPSVDRGVTAHLFGGAVFFQKVHPDSLPYIAVFQGDNYAVAAIAGLSANVSVDALYPALAKTRTVAAPVTPDERPSYVHIEVPDDTRSLRVVDSAGASVDCRSGDVLYVPTTERLVYILQSGNAEDLTALLRPASSHRLPIAEISALSANAPGADSAKPIIVLRLTNITAAEFAGTIKIIQPPFSDQKTPIVLAENPLPAIAPSKSLDLTLSLDGEIPTSPVIIEITTRHTIQKTAIVLPQPAAPIVPAPAPVFVPPAPPPTFIPPPPPSFVPPQPSSLPPPTPAPTVTPAPAPTVPPIPAPAPTLPPIVTPTPAPLPTPSPAPEPTPSALPAQTDIPAPPPPPIATPTPAPAPDPPQTPIRTSTPRTSLIPAPTPTPVLPQAPPSSLIPTPVPTRSLIPAPTPTRSLIPAPRPIPTTQPSQPPTSETPSMPLPETQP